MESKKCNVYESSHGHEHLCGADVMFSDDNDAAKGVESSVSGVDDYEDTYSIVFSLVGVGCLVLLAVFLTFVVGIFCPQFTRKVCFYGGCVSEQSPSEYDVNNVVNESGIESLTFTSSRETDAASGLGKPVDREKVETQNVSRDLQKEEEEEQQQPQQQQQPQECDKISVIDMPSYSIV